MDINYERLEWEDFPSTETPINADNLNHLEEGIAGLYAERYEMQSNIAYVEDGETASKDYLPNSYLMRDGLFYKVTKTILYGDSFDSGEDGNIEHVDISSQFGSGGGGSTGCVELTQAQYDALSDEAKMLDVIYLITDSPDNYLDEVFGDFATVEYTDTASKAYAVGDYLVYDSKFYRVSSAIAQGDTIIPDTNVEQTTVGEEVVDVKGDATAAGNEAAWLRTRFKPETDMADCNVPPGNVNKYGGNTLNSPYKAGVTTSQGGLIISYSPGQTNWNKQIAITDGNAPLFKRYTEGTATWSNWTHASPWFQFKSHSKSITVNANTTAHIDIDVSVSGYTPCAFSGFTTNHGSLLTQHIVLNATNNIVTVYVRNVSGASLTSPYSIILLYVCKGFGI